MNLYRIGVVATGLMGIWLLITGLSRAIGQFGFNLMNQLSTENATASFDWPRFFFPLIVILIILVSGTLIVFCRRQITRTWLLADSETDVPAIRDSVIAKVLFAIFGLSLIARGVYFVLWSGGRLLSHPHMSGISAYEVVAALAYVAIGFLVFRNASGLARRFSDEPSTRLNEPE